MESYRLIEPCAAGIRAASSILSRSHYRSRLPFFMSASSCLLRSPRQQSRGASDGRDTPWGSEAKIPDLLSAIGKKNWADPKARSTPKTASTTKSRTPPPAPPPTKSTPPVITSAFGKVAKSTVSWDIINTSTRKDSAAKIRRQDQERKTITNIIDMDIQNLINSQRKRQNPDSSFTAGAALSGQILGTEPLAPPKRPFFRRRPETGTIVSIQNKIDLGQALAILGSKVSQNRVAYMLRSQREHERPGLRKKRLRSERWKKQFSLGFKAAVKRANELAKMGW